MNIIKKIIKNKMKKVLDLFLNLGYNICVCESVRVKVKIIIKWIKSIY